MTEKGNGFIATGLGLIALAFIPTPDDVTVISPIIQIGAGLGLITWGYIDKNKK
jgi:hypothetical protein